MTKKDSIVTSNQFDTKLELESKNISLVKQDLKNGSEAKDKGAKARGVVMSPKETFGEDLEAHSGHINIEIKKSISVYFLALYLIMLS